MRFLVTAGSTREPIDRVREWANIFTGQTGYRIALALASRGPVDLLSSNRVHLAGLGSLSTAYPIEGFAFTSHADLKRELARLLGKHCYDAIFMSAAVSDYAPVRVFRVLDRQEDAGDPRIQRWVVQDAQADKVASVHPEIAVLGRQTEKLVDLFRTTWGYRGLLVKFKLEVGLDDAELLRIAEASRRKSGADYVLANTLEMVNGQRPGAYLVREGWQEWIDRDRLPERMLELVNACCEKR